MVAQKHKKLHEIFKISRSSLYYKSKKYNEDLKVKESIEKVWDDFPIKHKITSTDGKYPNLLTTIELVRINQIWVTDFTYLWYRNRFIYVATVIDIFNREVVGACVLINHSSALVVQALVSALMDHPKPDIVHSDQGGEYTAKIFQDFCVSSGIQISMSEKGSPWQNGYQESFYDKFKIDLGDPNRFETLGELVYEIYHIIYIYNTTRIHTSLKMSPREFALKNQAR